MMDVYLEGRHTQVRIVGRQIEVRKKMQESSYLGQRVNEKNLLRSANERRLFREL
jgi:hypothetical protein